jgi:uncharacterized membrane protein (DUF2068 family)
MTDSDHTDTSEAKHPVAKRRTLEAIAIFEAIKGIAAFAAVIGVLELMHRDVRHLALELIGHFGLNPDARYPEIILHYADLLPGANVRSLIALALGYVSVRMVEAYGLWNDRAWGEWLGALSGGLYIPFELTHMMRQPSIVNAAVLAGNIFVVGFLVFQLWRRPKKYVMRQ